MRYTVHWTMWPFKRKQLELSDLPSLAEDSGAWVVAQAEFHSAPLIIRLNKRARKWAGHPELPIKLGFAVPLNAPSDGGLPGAQENEQLNEVEDRIVAEVASRTVGIHAMALTTGVMKEFVFYIPDGVDIAAIHNAAQAAVTTHGVHCLAVHEPNWDSYRQFL